MLKGKTDEDLLNYALATDSTKIAVVQILNTMVTFRPPLLLKGAAMVEDETFSGEVPQAIEGFWWHKLILGLYLNDYDVIRFSLKKVASPQSK